MKKTLITLAAMIAFVALAASAQAYSLSWNDVTLGGTSDVVGGITVTSDGGTFSTKTSPYGSLGVTGGETGEIGIGQSITFEFAESQIVNSLTLSLLFSDGNYGDNGDEKAQITVYSGTQSYTYTLIADTGNVGIWDGQGTVTNLSPALDGSGGVWELSNNPFGTLAIDSIMLTALDSEAGASGSANSDFGFYSMETSPTPIPGAVWLLGTGLLGLIGLRGRFKG